jgi:hypothetical protein
MSIKAGLYVDGTLQLCDDCNNLAGVLARKVSSGYDLVCKSCAGVI